MSRQLLGHEAIAEVEVVALDAAGDVASALTRDVAQGAYGARSPEIDHEVVRVFGFFAARVLVVPDVGRLAIDGVFSGAIFFGAFLAADVGDDPSLVADGLSVSIEKIEFGNGGGSLAIMRIQGFETKEAAGRGCGEFDGL